MAVELIGSWTPSTRPSRSRGTTSKSSCRPISRSSATLPWRLRPKWKSSPTTTSLVRSCSCEHALDERPGRFKGLGLVETNQHRGIDAGGGEQLQFLFEIGQQPGRRLGAHNARWVTIEGDHDRATVRLLGEPSDIADHRLVSTMDAVVGPDRDHRAFSWPWRHREVRDHEHVITLSLTPRPTSVHRRADSPIGRSVRIPSDFSLCVSTARRLTQTAGGEELRHGRHQ